MKIQLELQLAEGIEAEMARGKEAGGAIMVIARMLDEGVIKSWKPPMATLAKWNRRGWWNYGVSLRSGWFEPGGLAAVYASITRRAQSQLGIIRSARSNKNNG